MILFFLFLYVYRRVPDRTPRSVDTVASRAHLGLYCQAPGNLKKPILSYIFRFTYKNLYYPVFLRFTYNNLSYILAV